MVQPIYISALRESMERRLLSINLERINKYEQDLS
jgi:hypothetical protein